MNEIYGHHNDAEDSIKDKLWKGKKKGKTDTTEVSS
jgi:hypothetical protein